MFKEIALEKLRRYCAYQDRCHQEVRQKLHILKVEEDDLEDIICILIEEKFLDEERYARSYVRGKFKIKKWGVNKIKQSLYMKKVSDYCIRKGLEEIDEKQYKITLEEVILKKLPTEKDKKSLLARDKAIKYAHSRGYESHYIFEIIKKIELDY